MSTDVAAWPERIQHLPRDERGFPIPYAAWQPDEHGSRPDFRVLDQRRVDECVDRRLCGVCGQALAYWIVFIGGPACLASRLFNDPAMHPDCAAFAAMACPFIAGPETRYSTAAAPVGPGILTSVDPAMAQAVRRPETMYLFTTRRYSRETVGGKRHIRASEYAHVDEVTPSQRLLFRRSEAGAEALP